jgi:hypothetical protein
MCQRSLPYEGPGRAWRGEGIMEAHKPIRPWVAFLGAETHPWEPLEASSPSPVDKPDRPTSQVGKIDMGQRAFWGAAGHPGAEDSKAWLCYFFAS